MANTIITYEGTGSTHSYVVPFEYLKKTFVRVTLGDLNILTGGNQTDPTAQYYFKDANTIYIKDAPAQGVLVTIRRYTSATDRVVNFKDASILKAKDLDTATIQTLHIAEEARDVINDALIKDRDGNWDAKDKTIKNIGDPVDPKDATNKKYIDDNFLKLGSSNFWEARGLNISNLKNPSSPQDAVTKKYVDDAVEMLKTLEEYEKTTKEARDEAVLNASQAKASASVTVEAVESTTKNRQTVETLTSEVRRLSDDVTEKHASVVSNAKDFSEKTLEVNENTQKAIISAQEAVANANSSADSASKAQKALDTINETYQNKVDTLTSVGDTWNKTITNSGQKFYDNITSRGTDYLNTMTEKLTETKNYASSASTSATNAKTSETNAKKSETNSKTSETNAKASEVEAKKQADLSRSYAEQSAAGQVNTDWNATSGKAQLLNKPDLSIYAEKSKYLPLTGGILTGNLTVEHPYAILLEPYSKTSPPFKGGIRNYVEGANLNVVEFKGNVLDTGGAYRSCLRLHDGSAVDPDTNIPKTFSFFELWARHNNTSGPKLIGTSANSRALTWDNKNVVRSVNNVNASTNGNVTLDMPYLPLKGGTLTGDLNLESGILYGPSKYSSRGLILTSGGGSYGGFCAYSGVGGLTAIGSGESAVTLRDHLDDYDMNPATKQMFITSDNNVNVVVSANEWNNRVDHELHVSGFDTKPKNLVKGTTPSSFWYTHHFLCEGAGRNTANRLSGFEAYVHTDGSTNFIIRCYEPVAGSTNNTYLKGSKKADGTSEWTLSSSPSQNSDGNEIATTGWTNTKLAKKADLSGATFTGDISAPNVIATGLVKAQDIWSTDELSCDGKLTAKKNVEVGGDLAVTKNITSKSRTVPTIITSTKDITEGSALEDGVLYLVYK